MTQSQAFTIRQYLNARLATYPHFSADGQSMLYLADITGIPQLWCSVINNYPTWADQITFEDDRVTWFSVIDDNRILFTRDTGGNENMQFFLLDESTASITPLTEGYEQVMHIPGKLSKDHTTLLFAANRRHPGLFDLYVQEIGAEARLVMQNEQRGFLAPWSFSPDGKCALVSRIAGSLDQSLFEVNISDGTVTSLAPKDKGAIFANPVYSLDGNSIYVVTNLDSEFAYIARIDRSSHQIERVITTDWDVEELDISPDGGTLAYTVNVHGASQLYLYDIATKSTQQITEAEAITGVIDSLSFSPDNTRLAYHKAAAKQTDDIFMYDRSATQLRQITRSSHGGIPASSLAEPILIHYPTYDQDERGETRQIPAWLYRPQSPTDAPTPVIVYVHGGPESQFRPNYFAWMQYFVKHGYAILAPNVRGSTGYGKTYTQLDNVRKRMDSVNDLAHAAYWIKRQPEFDGDHIIVYGRSYGGFMVLSALTTYPDLWAAGVEFVGISNWVTFLENTSEYRRSHRESEYGSLKDDREFLESISPNHHVNKIKAPLLVFHGANDPRVPVAETKQMVEAIRAQGVPVEFIIFEDEGHGMVKLKNKLVAYETILQFLTKLRES